MSDNWWLVRTNKNETQQITYGNKKRKLEQLKLELRFLFDGRNDVHQSFDEMLKDDNMSLGTYYSLEINLDV